MRRSTTFFGLLRRSLLARRTESLRSRSRVPDDRIVGGKRPCGKSSQNNDDIPGCDVGNGCFVESALSLSFLETVVSPAYAAAAVSRNAKTLSVGSEFASAVCDSPELVRSIHGKKRATAVI
eukprot:7153025-Ditylum_brightwellii.AAC.1